MVLITPSRPAGLQTGRQVVLPIQANSSHPSSELPTYTHTLTPEGFVFILHRPIQKPLSLQSFPIASGHMVYICFLLMFTFVSQARPGSLFIFVSFSLFFVFFSPSRLCGVHSLLSTFPGRTLRYHGGPQAWELNDWLESHLSY